MRNLSFIVLIVLTQIGVSCGPKNSDYSNVEDPQKDSPEKKITKKDLDISTMISGKDFTCVQNEEFKTTCFGRNDMSADSPLIKDAPSEKLKFISASKHEQFACGVKASDSKPYCWGTTGSQKIKNTVLQANSSSLVAIAIGDDSMCFVELNDPECGEHKAYIRCSDNITINTGTTGFYEPCILKLKPHLKMYGQSMLTTGLGSFPGGSVGLAFEKLSIDNEAEYIAIMKSKGKYFGLTIGGKTSFHKNTIRYSDTTMTDFDPPVAAALQALDHKNVNAPLLTAIDAGDNFFCIIKEADKSLECFGKTAESFNLPKDLKVKRIAAGTEHICVQAIDDNLKCYGSVVR